MKRTILTTGLLLIIFLSGLAQTGGLEFKRIQDQKTKYLQEGKKILVKSEGKKYKGKFQIISDSTILVESDTLLLADIQDIRTKSLLSALGGGLLFAYGVYGTGAAIYGIALIVADGAELALLGGLFFSSLAVGAAFIAVSGFTIMIHGKSHKSKRWKYKTLRNVPISNNRV